MATYLDAILQAHRDDAERDDRTLSELEESLHGAPAVRPFRAEVAEISGRGELAVIAEVKRRSPVTGEVGGLLDAAEMASAYAKGGATGLSVLTDGPHFGGSADDLRAARSATSLPVLRKDFTVSVADLYDARAMGADAVLLIVAALSEDELGQFVALAQELGLDALVEVHDEEEIDRALSVGANMIGVNQRDLRTFEVDPLRAARLRPHISPEVLAVAESGIRDAADAAALMDAGFDAVLVGTSIVTASDPTAAVHALRGTRRVVRGRA